MTTPYSIGVGFVVDREHVRLIARTDQIVELGGIHTKFMRWAPPRQWSTFDFDWIGTRIAVTATSRIIAGPQGYVLVGTTGTPVLEEVDPSGQGAERSGDFLDLRMIGGSLYICGMSRQVYRREGPNAWVRADQGVVQPAGSMDIAGFVSMDGLSEGDFYAVGFGGEIWRCLKGKWQQVPSPTNVVLQCVRVVAPNRIYVCGQQGLILHGDGSNFRVIDSGGVREDLWSIQPFNDFIYLASERNLYRLNPDDSLEQLDTGLGEDATYRHLHANDGRMFSFGAKTVAWTDDAVTWTDVTP